MNADGLRYILNEAPGRKLELTLSNGQSLIGIQAKNTSSGVMHFQEQQSGVTFHVAIEHIVTIRVFGEPTA